MRIRQSIIGHTESTAEDRGTERLIKHGQKFQTILNKKIKKVLTSLDGSAIVAVNKEQMQRTEYGRQRSHTSESRRLV